MAEKTYVQIWFDNALASYEEAHLDEVIGANLQHYAPSEITEIIRKAFRAGFDSGVSAIYNETAQ